MYCRTYVQVTACYDEEGIATPLTLRFKDREMPIDRVMDRRQAAATKAGGQGMRYTIRIGSHHTYLFQDEHQRWFVEEHLNVH